MYTWKEYHEKQRARLLQSFELLKVSMAASKPATPSSPGPAVAADSGYSVDEDVNMEDNTSGKLTKHTRRKKAAKTPTMKRRAMVAAIKEMLEGEEDQFLAKVYVQVWCPYI
jgi:hypothetical protein